MGLLCPACGETQVTDASVCGNCCLPFAWIPGFPEFYRELCATQQLQLTVAPKVEPTSITVALSRQSLTRLGRGRENDHALPDSAVESQHAIIVPYHAEEADTDVLCRFFLVDCRTRIGTFINRKRIRATELRGGDVIQIGPFAWSFSALDGQLVPLSPIAGIGLQLTGLHVTGRLGPQFDLGIQPGQFVALVGGSGAGKSTLVKVLAGQPGLIAAGQVDVLEPNGSRWVRREKMDRFRDALGYVSQDSILHETLTARQILTTSAQLRGEASDAATVELALLRAEIERERWDQPIGTLSGGQNKRIRTASELMGLPRLLLLDEPDSGLDKKRRAALMKLLRALSWQGCTVVLVTHAEDDLTRYCDRIVRIQQGRIVQDDPAVEATQTRISTAEPGQSGSGAGRSRRTSQLGILIARECALLDADWWSQLAVPTIVAILFALAVAVAVEPTHVPLLGFLSIVSVLWMSASGSLLSIAGERAVFDHERQLVLSIHQYLLAKFLVAAVVAVVQTLLFISLLSLSRWALEFQSFLAVGWAVSTLCLTSMAGVALGLCLSALAGRKKETAAFLLPLVMIAQLVFSVPVADPDAARDSVVSAYSKFRPDQKQVWLAASLSRLTISRPADMALRAMIYDPSSEQKSDSMTYRTWGLAMLASWAVGQLLLTFLLLQWGYVSTGLTRKPGIGFHCS